MSRKVELVPADKFRLDRESVEVLKTKVGGWTALTFNFVVGKNEKWPPKRSGWKQRYLGEWRSRRDYIELLEHLADRDEKTGSK